MIDGNGNPLEPRPDDDNSTWGPGSTVLLYPARRSRSPIPPARRSGYEPFQFRTLLQLCAALGIPYAELSGDLTKASYASSRAGLLAFRTEVEAFQHAVLVYQFLRKVWTAGWTPPCWPAASDLGHRVQQTPGKFRVMQAITPRAPWVDPLKDRQAVKLAMDSQVIAPQDAIEAEGYDIETVYRRIAEAAELRKQYGIADPPPGSGTGAEVARPHRARRRRRHRPDTKEEAA